MVVGSLVLAQLYRSLKWWLVDHPHVSSFQWEQNNTLGASAPFLATTIALYLSLTFLLHRRILPLPRPPPRLLRLLTSLHNLALILLSLAMAAGCSLAALHQMPSPRWVICFPAGATTPRGPVFFWAHVFYLSKIYEFADTLLIIAGGTGRRRLSFLHVYHHAAVVAISYEWLAAPQSMMALGIVTNASVHVVMYSYYLSSGLGWRWSAKWKRAVTDCQILQFVFSFVVSLVLLWVHFMARGGGGGGCTAGMGGWVFNVAFNASLLALFLDFHSKNYSSAQKLKVV